MQHLLIAAACLAGAAAVAQTADLRDAWQSASGHHPDMAAAEASMAAGDARRLQARRVWQPTVAMQATAGAMGAQTRSEGAAFALPGAPRTPGVGFDTSVHHGPGARWGLEARLPVYSPQRSAQERQLDLSADMAELEAAAMRQQLMLSTAQQYFAAVLTQQQHALLLRHQEASEKALSEAQDRFRLGDAPVTDLREAEARSRAVAAQLQAAEVEMHIAQNALAQTTGWSATRLPTLAPPAPPARVASDHSAGALERWLDTASQHNLDLRLKAQRAALAEQEASKAARFAAAQVDVVAQAGGDRVSGTGRWGSASNASRQYAVGLQVQVPLFTGGQRAAREQELQSLLQKARAEHDSARLSVAQQVRAVWLRLHAGAAHGQALEAALQAARERLGATTLGRQVGDRTTLELLHAQNDLLQAETQVLQHRSRLAQERLTLSALAGSLAEPELAQATAPLPDMRRP